jgi:hypothetical protein
VKNREAIAYANSEHQALASHGSSLTDTVSSQLTALLTSFGDKIFSLPGADGGAINLVNGSHDALVTAHLKLPQDYAGIQNGYKGFEYRFDQPDINVQVFLNSTPAIVSNDNLENFAEITKLRFKRWKMCSLMVVPIAVRQTDGSIQTIDFQPASKFRFFGDRTADRNCRSIFKADSNFMESAFVHRAQQDCGSDDRQHATVFRMRDRDEQPHHSKWCIRFDCQRIYSTIPL